MASQGSVQDPRSRKSNRRRGSRPYPGNTAGGATSPRSARPSSTRDTAGSPGDQGAQRPAMPQDPRSNQGPSPPQDPRSSSPSTPQPSGSPGPAPTHGPGNKTEPAAPRDPRNKTEPNLPQDPRNNGPLPGRSNTAHLPQARDARNAVPASARDFGSNGAGDKKPDNNEPTPTGDASTKDDGGVKRAKDPRGTDSLAKKEASAANETGARGRSRASGDGLKAKEAGEGGRYQPSTAKNESRFKKVFKSRKTSAGLALGGGITGITVATILFYGAIFGPVHFISTLYNGTFEAIQSGTEERSNKLLRKIVQASRNRSADVVGRQRNTGNPISDALFNRKLAIKMNRLEANTGIKFEPIEGSTRLRAVNIRTGEVLLEGNEGMRESNRILKQLHPELELALKGPLKSIRVYGLRSNIRHWSGADLSGILRDKTGTFYERVSERVKAKADKLNPLRSTVDPETGETRPPDPDAADAIDSFNDASDDLTRSVEAGNTKAALAATTVDAKANFKALLKKSAGPTAAAVTIGAYCIARTVDLQSSLETVGRFGSAIGFGYVLGNIMNDILLGGEVPIGDVGDANALFNDLYSIETFDEAGNPTGTQEIVRTASDSAAYDRAVGKTVDGTELHPENRAFPDGSAIEEIADTLGKAIGLPIIGFKTTLNTACDALQSTPGQIIGSIVDFASLFTGYGAIAKVAAEYAFEEIVGRIIAAGMIGPGAISTDPVQFYNQGEQAFLLMGSQAALNGSPVSPDEFGGFIAQYHDNQREDHESEGFAHRYFALDNPYSPATELARTQTQFANQPLLGRLTTLASAPFTLLGNIGNVFAPVSAESKVWCTSSKENADGQNSCDPFDNYDIPMFVYDASWAGEEDEDLDALWDEVCNYLHSTASCNSDDPLSNDPDGPGTSNLAQFYAEACHAYNVKDKRVFKGPGTKQLSLGEMKVDRWIENRESAAGEELKLGEEGSLKEKMKEVYDITDAQAEGGCLNATDPQLYQKVGRFTFDKEYLDHAVYLADEDQLTPAGYENSLSNSLASIQDLSGVSVSVPTGDEIALAQRILDSSNITLRSAQEGQIRSIANGTSTAIDKGVLQLLVALDEAGNKFTVSSLKRDGSATASRHNVGLAVDISGSAGINGRSFGYGDLSKEVFDFIVDGATILNSIGMGGQCEIGVPYRTNELNYARLRGEFSNCKVFFDRGSGPHVHFALPR